MNSVGVCSHTRVEPVRTYGDSVIAWRCALCTTIMSHHGKCDGCNAEDVKLPELTSSLRYCGADCRRRHETRMRSAKKSESKAKKK